MEKKKIQILLRNFVIELVVYGTLVITYSVVVLRLLVEPLSRFFNNNLIVYALVSLMLIVAQGVLLDAITSFLLDRLRLERLE
ncbi:MAG: hypothetical protein V3S14_16635 [Anaerolineae bacterium]